MLRLQGRSFNAIGKALGCSTSTAHGYVMSALDEYVGEPAESVRSMEVARLDMLLEQWLPQALGTAPGSRGPSKDAANVVLGIMDRRSRLLGLDAPQRVEVEQRKGVSDDLLGDAEGAALVAQASAYLAARRA